MGGAESKLGSCEVGVAKDGDASALTAVSADKTVSGKAPSAGVVKLLIANDLRADRGMIFADAESREVLWKTQGGGVVDADGKRLAVLQKSMTGSFATFKNTTSIFSSRPAFEGQKSTVMKQTYLQRKSHTEPEALFLAGVINVSQTCGGASGTNQVTASAQQDPNDASFTKARATTPVSVAIRKSGLSRRSTTATQDLAAGRQARGKFGGWSVEIARDSPGLGLPIAHCPPRAGSRIQLRSSWIMGFCQCLGPSSSVATGAAGGLARMCRHRFTS